MRTSRVNLLPTTSQVTTLEAVRALTGAGGTTSAHAVAARLGVARVTAWRVMRALERKGLLGRDDDGRWSLTLAGARWAGLKLEVVP